MNPDTSNVTDYEAGAASAHHPHTSILSPSPSPSDAIFEARAAGLEGDMEQDYMYHPPMGVPSSSTTRPPMQRHPVVSFIDDDDDDDNDQGLDQPDDEEPIEPNNDNHGASRHLPGSLYSVREQESQTLAWPLASPAAMAERRRLRRARREPVDRSSRMAIDWDQEDVREQGSLRSSEDDQMGT